MRARSEPHPLHGNPEAVGQSASRAAPGRSVPDQQGRPITRLRKGDLCHYVPRRGTSYGRILFVAEHYTLRLAPETKQRLTAWARRVGMAERTLAQRYVDEGLRHDAHPLIQFVDGPGGRRASLVGRGLDVWEVIATVRDNHGSIDEAARYLDVPVGLVEAAVAYYGEYRSEIDDEIEANEAEYTRGLAASAAGRRALGA